MPVNKRYLLNRIITIQDIILEQSRRGIPQIKTYREIIYPRFLISPATFKNYMGRNAKKELKELDARQTDLVEVDYSVPLNEA